MYCFVNIQQHIFSNYHQLLLKFCKTCFVLLSTLYPFDLTCDVFFELAQQLQKLKNDVPFKKIGDEVIT